MIAVAVGANGDLARLCPGLPLAGPELDIPVGRGRVHARSGTMAKGAGRKEPVEARRQSGTCATLRFTGRDLGSPNGPLPS